ncbi:MAG: hypothetical protein N2Z76_10300 [Treponemataceae bacterium]|nr:hypothetical protein [Treponemataceae bacterium]
MKEQKLKSGIVWLVALGVMAVILAACPTESPSSGGENPLPTKVSLTDTYAVYWLDIAAADLGGLEGFHLKNLSNEPVGIVIDRIVAADSKSLEGAFDVFTFSDPETGTHYWGFTTGGTISNGEWSSGEVAAPVAPETETYITGFATSLFVSHPYVGIVAKNLSSTVKGDKVAFVPIIGSPVVEKTKNFEDLFIY